MFTRGRLASPCGCMGFSAELRLLETNSAERASHKALTGTREALKSPARLFFGRPLSVLHLARGSSVVDDQHLAR